MRQRRDPADPDATPDVMSEEARQKEALRIAVALAAFDLAMRLEGRTFRHFMAFLHQLVAPELLVAETDLSRPGELRLTLTQKTESGPLH
jgi:hypothetical protein